MCIHENNDLIVVSTINNKIFYCIECIWYEVKDNKQKNIPLLQLQSIHSMGWSELMLSNIIKGEFANEESYENYEKIMSEDLDVPILVTKIDNSFLPYYAILSGKHKYAKAFLNSKKNMRCIEVSSDIIKKYTLNKTICKYAGEYYHF